jgi:crotonobetainyl-CoA:carnitine CoA-transferase CaiB-like acyl-CoA transferase
MFQSANRNKQAITLNLSKERGKDLLRQLVAKADVLIENFRVDTMERYGLGYEALREINPGLIFCSITGYGQTGPYRERGGYDPIIQAQAGMMSVTGFPEDQPGGGPMKAGPSVVDMTAGNYAVIAIQSALIQRAGNGGHGQFIDISLFDVGVTLAGQFGLHYLASGQIPGLVGTQANGGAPGGGYKCSDGYIMIAPGSQTLYELFCEAISRPDLATDARFLTNTLRVQNRPALLREIDLTLAQITVADLYEKLVEVGVPASPVNNLKQVLDDPHVKERGLLKETQHPQSGTHPVFAIPIKASGNLLVESRATPDIGQDTRQIMSEDLGLSEDEIAALSRDRII